MRRHGSFFVVQNFEIYYPLNKDDEQNLFPFHLQHSLVVVDENLECVHAKKDGRSIFGRLITDNKSETDDLQFMKPTMSLTAL